MALSKYERKERLPYGAQSEIAVELDLSEATVSLVMNEKTESLTAETVEKVQTAIANRIGLPRTQVFPEPDAAAEVAKAN